MRKPLLFLLGLLGSGALAQAQQRDPGFHNARFQNGATAARLGAVVRQADGRYLVTGDFTTVDGHPTRSVARIMADGQVDESFRGPRLGQYAGGLLAVQADGRVLVWADSVRAIVRLLPSGAPDASFVLDTTAALGTRLRQGCSAIVVQPDGRIVVAGLQTLVRLNPDGSRDPGFQSPALSADMHVRGVSLEPTGGLTYITASPVMRNQVTTGRLLPNGTPDASFTAQTLPSSDANGLVRQPDGRYLLGGLFGFSGQRRISLLRLLPNGALDPSVVAGPIGTNISLYFQVGPVRALAVQADGHILVGGNGMFGSGFGAMSALQRCTPDGQFDTTFDDLYLYTARTITGMPGYTYNNASVGDLLVEPNGKVMVSGSFQQAGGQPSAGLTRLLAAQPLAARPAAETTAQLWPNPAREQLTLRFDGAAPPRRVALLDATGRPVLAVAGAPTLTLPTAGLARGLYVLRFDYDGRTASRRVALE